MGDEPFDPEPDRLLIAALDRVDVSGAQQRQESQSGRGRVRLERILGRAAVPRTMAVVVEAPTPVDSLVPGQPLEAVLDGPFGTDGAPLATDHRRLGKPLPAGEGRRRVLNVRDGASAPSPFG